MVYQLPSGDPNSFEFDPAPVFTDGRAQLVAKTAPILRAWFIVKVYFHLFASVLLLAVFEIVWFGVTNVGGWTLRVMSLGIGSWLLVLCAMAALSYVARRHASKSRRLRRQYLGWLLYTALQSLLSAPMIAYGIAFSSGNDTTLLPRGIVITLVIFGCLFAIAIQRRNKFRRVPVLSTFAGLAAAAIVMFSFSFGFTQALLITYAVLVVACGSIVHLTFAALEQHRTDEHVSAALGLLASALPPLWWLLPPLAARLRRAPAKPAVAKSPGAAASASKR
ncbi:MAG TPA: Bax inhibitor-1 family protein [Polyangiales bacterium]